METASDLGNLNGKKVLVVDDMIDNQILECTYLRKLGIQYDVASGGQEAIDKALGGDHDAILMDLHMPYMDGLSATTKLRDCGYKKPIIAVTADRLDSTKLKAFSVGMNDYILKPLRMSTLFRSLEKHLIGLTQPSRREQGI